ncbi:MAG TPA: DMT family transporter [Burkholderiales bacterium]|nr:DMT family transporter [Burkholderiales bacterium]
MQARTLTDWILLTALVAFWGSNFMFIKLGVAAVPPASLVAARLAIGAVILVAVIRSLGYVFPPVGRAWAPYVVLAVVGNCMPFWFITWGQKHLDSALAGILMAVMPLTTLLLAHFFVAGERMTHYRFAGFLLGFIGVVLLTGPAALASMGGSPVEILAQLAVLCGGLCYAINGVIIRVALKGDVMVASAAIIAIAALISIPVALALDQPWRLEVSSTSALIVIWIGVGPTAIATLLHLKLISSAGPTFVSLINYFIPVVALILGVALLDEEPAANAYSGLALILSGIALSQLRRASSRSAASRN